MDGKRNHKERRRHGRGREREGRRGRGRCEEHVELRFCQGFPGGSGVRNPLANAGDVGLIPGSGRSPGAGNGNPFQCSCLENPMARRAWQPTRHRVAKSRVRLSADRPGSSTLMLLFSLSLAVRKYLYIVQTSISTQRFDNSLIIFV